MWRSPWCDIVCLYLLKQEQQQHKSAKWIEYFKIVYVWHFFLTPLNNFSDHHWLSIRHPGHSWLVASATFPIFQMSQNLHIAAIAFSWCCTGGIFAQPLESLKAQKLGKMSLLWVHNIFMMSMACINNYVNGHNDFVGWWQKKTNRQWGIFLNGKCHQTAMRLTE